MKKNQLLLLCLFSLSIALIACSDEMGGVEAVETDEPGIEIEDEYFITESQAVQIALQAKNAINKTRSRNTYSVANVRKIGQVNARSSESSSLLYVVEFDDDNGCAVIAGKRTSDPVLAVTEKGYLTYGTAQDNPGAEMFMKQAQTYVKGLVLNPIDTLKDNYRYWEDRLDTLIYVSVPQRLNIAWHQKYPLNQFCPIIGGNYSLTGCGPLSCAMMMSYFQYPKSIVLTYNGSGEVQNLNWKGIHAVMSVDPYSNIFGQFTEGYEKMAAQLIREIGHKVNVEYGVDCSGVSSIHDLIGYLAPLGFGHSSSLSMPSLSNERKSIVLVQGDNHVFIIDGQERLWTQLVETIYEFKAGIKTKISEEIINESFYNRVHVNWGWGGVDNGYYNANVLQTKYPVALDNTITYGDAMHGEYNPGTPVFYEFELVI